MPEQGIFRRKQGNWLPCFSKLCWWLYRDRNMFTQGRWSVRRRRTTGTEIHYQGAKDTKAFCGYSPQTAPTTSNQSKFRAAAVHLWITRCRDFSYIPTAQQQQLFPSKFDYRLEVFRSFRKLLTYSCRNAVAGSIRAALRAGK